MGTPVQTRTDTQLNTLPILEIPWDRSGRQKDSESTRRSIKDHGDRKSVRENHGIKTSIGSNFTAIKPFLLPTLDFHILNGEVGRKQPSAFDSKIRESINQELKVRSLPIDCHHASWRDGGLSYPSLQDGNDVLTIRSFTQMLLSQDT
jgi:hypothetical protein